MKKIISIIAAFAMAASMTSVFAAKPDDLVEPHLNFSIDETGDTDPDAGSLYLLTVDLSDLGTLTHTKVSATKFSGMKIVGFNFGIEGQEILLSEASGNLGASKFGYSADCQVAGNGYDGIYIDYSDSAAKTAYPTIASTTSCDGAAEVYFYGKPGATVTLRSATLNYANFIENTAQGPATQVFAKIYDEETASYKDTVTVTLPGGAPVVKDIAIEATAEKTTATGCIWNVALTNAAKINEFKATFKADGAEDAVRYIRNIADVASAVSGEGSLNFQVGVLTDTTTKTGIKAAFDVKDSDGKTASTGDVAAAAK